MSIISLNNRQLKPLYMWAGGKSKLLKEYSPLVPNLDNITSYVEPFFGGGALFAAIKSGYPSLPGMVNDINSELIGLLNTTKNDYFNFIEELKRLETEYLSLPYTSDNKEKRKEYFYQKRKEYWVLPEGETKTVALLYFLMKTAFNGIWQGCKESQGRFGTPAGLLNHKKNVFDYDLIKSWSDALQNTSIFSGSYDALDIPEKSWIFCDPPYRDSFTTYSLEFGDTHQLALIDWCRKMHQEKGCTVWLANREANDHFFENHAYDAEIHKFDIFYTAGRRKKTDTGYEAKKAQDLLMIWK